MCLSSHEKKIDKILTHFGDGLCRKFFFFIARFVQLDNIVNPPGYVQSTLLKTNGFVLTLIKSPCKFQCKA